MELTYRRPVDCFRSDRADEFSEMCVHLLRQPDELQIMGARGRREVTEKYSPSVGISRIIEVFREVGEKAQDISRVPRS